MQWEDPNFLNLQVCIVQWEDLGLSLYCAMRSQFSLSQVCIVQWEELVCICIVQWESLGYLGLCFCIAQWEDLGLCL